MQSFRPITLLVSDEVGETDKDKGKGRSQICCEAGSHKQNSSPASAPPTKADHKHQALPTASVNSNEWKRLWEFKTQCKNFEVTFELSNLSF